MATPKRRPAAAVWQRSVVKKEPGNWLTRRPDLAHVGFETMRGALCAVHDRYSSDYRGVSSEGWVFHCPGGRLGNGVTSDGTVSPTLEGIPGPKRTPSSGHFFLALPTEDVGQREQPF